MIRINCTNCKTLLTIDDAFAGGVCRCLHCGTIQTVPSHLKNAAATQGAQSKPAGTDAAKALYGKKVKADGTPGTGLDAIAEVVAGSGLSGSGLNAARAKRATYELPPKKNPLLLLLIGAGVLILLLAGAVLYYATRGPARTAPVNPVDSQPELHAAPQDQPASAAPDYHVAAVRPTPHLSEPAFLGVAISESSVVYLLDSSGATRATFDPMVQACFRSLDSLKPNQKFAVVFWHSDTDVSFPAKGMLPATPQNVESAKEHLKDIYASGASDVRPSLKRALSEKPAVICLASGKWLQDDFAKLVLDAVKGSSVKFDCFSLGQGDSSTTLKKISDATRGQFREVPPENLKSFGQ